MSLASPWSLLWLLPLAGGILVLWMLRLRREEAVVSSLYLWRALLRESQANTPFQKLRRRLLLFLQLLVAFLLVFALARPFVYGQPQRGRTLVLILDTSASMNATDVSPSRLAAAKAAAVRFVRQQMAGGDIAAVIAAGSRPATRIGFTASKPRLEDAIDATGGTDTVADIPQALSLALSLAGTRPGALIRLFSDGAYAPEEVRKIDALPLGGADVRLVPIGTADPDNVGITAMDGRRSPVTGRYEVFVEVRNLGSRQHSGAALSLYRNGALIDARPLTLPGGGQSETFDSPLLAGGGLITARLDDLQDDLAADNQASLVLPPPRRHRVLLVSRGNLFLERGLNLGSDVVLEECAPAEFATLGKSGAGYALVVFDGALPAAPLPPGNYLVFDAVSPQTPLTGSGAALDGPVLIDQSRTHPVMRFVDLEGIHLRRALQTRTAPWAQTLADAEGGPLVAAGEHDGVRAVSVAFDLSDSDWPLRVSFPIFLSNAVGWLAASGAPGAVAPDTPTGGVAALTLRSGLNAVEITGPDKQSRLVAAEPGRTTLLFAGTDRAGLYRAHAPGYDQWFAVNLLSRAESTLAVQTHPSLDHAGSSGGRVLIGRAPRARNDLWIAAAAGALAFLLLEWIVFHRRI